jgi:hypothetical protein
MKHTRRNAIRCEDSTLVMVGLVADYIEQVSALLYRYVRHTQLRYVDMGDVLATEAAGMRGADFTVRC